MEASTATDDASLSDRTRHPSRQSKQSPDPDTLLIEAYALRAVGSITEARDRCLAAVEASGGRTETVLLAAELLRANGDLMDSVGLLRAHATAGSNRGLLVTELGSTLRARGRMGEAVATLTRSLQIAPESIEASCELACCFLDAKQPARAVRSLRKAAETAAEAWHHNLAAAQLLGRYGYPGLAEPFLVEAAASGPREVVRYVAASIRGVDTPARAAPEYVKLLFDSCANIYDRRMTDLRNRGPELLRTALESSNLTQSSALDVLDAGCGTGLCGPVLRPYARRLAGVDLSELTLAHAGARECYDMLTCLDIVDVDNPFGATFDLVVCSDVLVYFGALEPVLGSLRRCLKRNGLLFVTVEALRERPGAPDHELRPTGRYWHRASYVSEALCAAGFERSPTLTRSVLRDESGLPVEAICATAVNSREKEQNDEPAR